MARRRLTPAQPGHTTPGPAARANGLTARLAPIAQVAGQSAEAAAARDLAESLRAAHDEGRMILEVPLEQIDPDFLLRDRVVLDRAELDALKNSLQDHGQRTPAEISATEGRDGAGPSYGLISGWRRLTALRELHSETGEARFAVLRAVIRHPAEVSESYVAMVEENEIRVGLSYYERARLVAELTRRGIFEDQTAALRTLFANASRAKRSKIGSFVDLVEAFDGILRFPTDIPERLGLAVVARLRRGGTKARVDVSRQLKALPLHSGAAEELQVLEGFATGSDQTPTIKDAGAESGAASARSTAMERLRSDLSMRVQHRGEEISVTLSGAALDEAMLTRLRRLLTADD